MERKSTYVFGFNLAIYLGILKWKESPLVYSFSIRQFLFGATLV